MPIERGNQNRINQVSDWLRDNFPTPYPVTVRTPRVIAPKRNLGETYREGRRIIIRICLRKGIPRYVMIETLLHEWAHACSMKHDCLEGPRLSHGAHDDEWALSYGKVYRKFMDDGGQTISGNY